uniref:NADH-ubiquinone oxidoreductase chain 4L n=1 Tax=Staphylinidae sp. BMNH 1274634 TaxID=1796578 RepID=A0A126TFN1_9COLE|nr:NADH dehydrogenase subunit 4L [Staphylinidae sp. BMNH 1274634]
MLIMMFFSIFLYFMGLISFSLKRKHFLLMLLSLELIVLSLFMILFINLSMIGCESFFSMIFLTMSVCEGALGLSILVSLMRSHSNDYFQTFNLLW